ncbi:hypothetical protein [Nocardia sp. NPDC050710]|uniref:LppU family putative lipoprotein n=1 Tax=Nocardia sp. NPDC050710 TaxID=3157220 RepID=UPI0033FDB2ED
MPRQRIRAGITLTGIVVAAAVSTAVVAVVALRMTGNESAPAKSHNAASTSTLSLVAGEAKAAAEPTPSAVGNRGKVEKATTGLQLTVGDCVELNGSGDNAHIGKTACGGANSRYKIIDTAAPDSHCPTDADHTYNETLRGSVRAALCLDIDWVVGGCMALTPHDPQRIDCTTPTTPDAVRVLDIKRDTTDANTCSSGDHGIVYQQRKFVVCVASL